MLLRYTFAILSVLSLPASVLAQNPNDPNDYKPMVTIPFVTGDLSVEAYINALYLLAISVAAVMAVLKITIAGVKYMLDDVVTHKQEAKKDIYGAIFGLVIVLAAVVILNTINPQLTTFDILATGRTGEPTTAGFNPIPRADRALPESCAGANATPRVITQINPITGKVEIVSYGCINRTNLNQDLTATAQRYLEIMAEIDAMSDQEARTAAGQARLRALHEELQAMIRGARGGGGGGGESVDQVGTGICEGRDPGDTVQTSVQGGSCPAGSVFRENPNDDTDAVTGSCVCPNV